MNQTTLFNPVQKVASIALRSVHSRPMTGPMHS